MSWSVDRPRSDPFLPFSTRCRLCNRHESLIVIPLAFREWTWEPRVSISCCTTMCKSASRQSDRTTRERLDEIIHRLVSRIYSADWIVYANTDREQLWTFFFIHEERGSPGDRRAFHESELLRERTVVDRFYRRNSTLFSMYVSNK